MPGLSEGHNVHTRAGLMEVVKGLAETKPGSHWRRCAERLHVGQQPGPSYSLRLTSAHFVSADVWWVVTPSLILDIKFARVELTEKSAHWRANAFFRPGSPVFLMPTCGSWVWISRGSSLRGLATWPHNHSIILHCGTQLNSILSDTSYRHPWPRVSAVVLAICWWCL